MLDYLPREILECILHKLSLKTLVLCCSVCKEWKSLITDPSFISDHIDHTIKTNNGNHHLVFRPWRFDGFKEYLKQHFDNEQVDLVPKCSEVGMCNGLVCLHNVDVGFIIWNPSIRKYMVLPEPIDENYNGDDDDAVKCFGFGFDYKNNDFKVVRLVSHLNKPSSSQVEVYSLAAQRWKTFTGNEAPLFKLKWKTKQMFRNGVLHCIVRRNQTHENFIMTFDLVEETFGEIMLPESLREKDLRLSVFEGGDLLAVIHCSSSLPLFNFEQNFSLWVMKEYGIVESWVKVYPSYEKFVSRDLLKQCNGRGEITASDEDNIRSDRKNLRIKEHGNVSSTYFVESLFLLDQSTEDVISY